MTVIMRVIIGTFSIPVFIIFKRGGGGGVIAPAGKRKHRFALYIHGIVVPGNPY
jgi:hypothetical protein